MQYREDFMQCQVVQKLLHTPELIRNRELILMQKIRTLDIQFFHFFHLKAQMYAKTY